MELRIPGRKRASAAEEKKASGQRGRDSRALHLIAALAGSQRCSGKEEGLIALPLARLRHLAWGQCSSRDWTGKGISYLMWQRLSELPVAEVLVEIQRFASDCRGA